MKITYTASPGSRLQAVEWCCLQAAKEFLEGTLTTPLWPDGLMVVSYNKNRINFCPWCGTKIEVVRP